MASEEDDEIKRKDKAFYEYLSRSAMLYMPKPELIAAAKLLLEEGFHPYDAAKLLSTGPSYGREAAAVYAALGINPKRIMEEDKWKK